MMGRSDDKVIRFPGTGDDASSDSTHFSKDTEAAEAFERKRKRHPTKTLAILFTDLKGSAGIKDKSGIHYAQDLELEHKDLLLDALDQIGTIYDDKLAQAIRVEGDSYILVFANASEAVHFALLAQRMHRDRRHGGLEDLPEFRVGIHSGEVIVEDGLNGPKITGGIGDIKGLHADMTARIMGLAQGGQILMSETAYDNACQSLKGLDLEEIPGELKWACHGDYRMEGKEAPIKIWEVGEAGLAPMTQPGDKKKGKRVPGPESSPPPSPAPGPPEAESEDEPSEILKKTLKSGKPIQPLLEDFQRRAERISQQLDEMHRRRDQGDDSPDLESRVIDLSARQSALERIIRELDVMIPFLCDRDEQWNGFREFFRQSGGISQKRPQFYLIHGKRSECHESLIRRLQDKCIRIVALKMVKHRGLTISSNLVKWPAYDGGTARRKYLKQYLFDAFHKDGLYDPERDDDYCVARFRELPMCRRTDIVIIQHDIETQEWLGDEEKMDSDLKLLKWYKDEYWADVDSFEGFPQIIIFVNLIYPDDQPMVVQKGFLFKKRIDIKAEAEGNLRKFMEQMGGGIRFSMLKELQPVTKKDVDEWFKIYGGAIAPHQSDREVKIAAIFRGSETSKCMREVEKALIGMHREYTRALIDEPG